LQLLAHETFSALRANAAVIERDAHGDKVLRLADGDYLKLFRRKRWLSSTAWYPYAQRFADNADALRQLDVPSPEAIAVYRIPAIERDAVQYHPLAGDTLRTLAAMNESPSVALATLLGTFIARLHAEGIYFRSVHLGNILLCPDGRLGLIDLADMKLHRRALHRHERIRNFRHLLRDERDRRWLLADNGRALFAAYGDPRVTSAVRLGTKRQQ
jgi:hypothetical protein